MNKAELIAAVAQKTGLSKKDSDRAVCAVFDSITENLKKGGKVQIVGFGAFEVRQRAAHIGRNPRTKEEVRIPATSVPAFRAGKALKDEISK